MDPVTHSLTGAVLSRAGLSRVTPLATVTLVLGANAPDIDAVVMLQGTYTALAARRGLTHGPLALLVLPFIVAGVVLLYDRVWRRRRSPMAEAARPLAVLGLAALGVLTHPPLDWMNTYGIRLLMPFAERWFYGDALFIIDPWIWLLLAVPVVGLAASRRGRTGWVLLGIGASLLVLLAPQVPLGARIVWVAAVAAVAVRAGAAWRSPAGESAGAVRRDLAIARVALTATAVYIAAMIGADRLGRGETMRAAAAAGYTVEQLMVAPVPANPFAADIVVEEPDAYRLGRLDWFAAPRVEWTGSVAKGERTAEVLATLQLQQVRDFLRWSRFPYVELRETAAGHVVRFGDARYPGGMRGGLSGVVVEVARPPGPAGQSDTPTGQADPPAVPSEPGPP
jgi:inner membrane protein